MPWSAGAFTRTNGVHTGATLWTQDRDAGTKILASRHDTHDQDLAGGINSTLEKSGSNAATGNLNIGSNRLTAVADGTAKTDAATVNQIQSNAPAFQATDTGTANAHVIALSPAVTAYAAGQKITFKSGAASTTSSTLNVNGLGVKTIKKKNDQNIAAGDIESGSIVTVVYDGTNFQMTSQLATDDGLTIGGSNTQVQYNNSGALAGDADFTFDGSNVSLAKALYLADGAVATPSVTNTGDVNTGVYFPAADTVGVVTGGVEQFRFGSNPIPGGSKNMVINGSMKVAQRGTLTGLGASTTATSADLWKLFIETNASRVTTTVEAAPALMIADGFGSALKIDVTTVDSSPAGSDFIGVEQRFEGQNLQHLLYGTAGAKELTVSFWFQSPKSGTHIVYLVQNDGNYGCPMTFTVTSADTAEKFSVTFPALTTSGQDFDNNNAFSMALGFPLMSNGYESTANQWNSGGTWRSTSAQQNLVDNTANNIYISGVQLEVGSVATSFAHKSVGDELLACQRYLQTWSEVAGTNPTIASGFAYSTSRGWFSMPLNPTMRTNPTFSYVGTASRLAMFYDNVTAVIATDGALYGQATSPFGIDFLCDVASGTPLAAQEPMLLFIYAGSAGAANQFRVSAEL